jgi:cyclophilin family peptidyl-prolyl cis-trans isomerase
MRTFWMVALAGALVGLSACGGGSSTQKAQEQPGSAAGGGEMGQSAAAESTQGGAMNQAKSPQEEIVERSMNKDPGPADEVAVLKTTMGDITLRFYPKQAPLAVSNFKGLAAKGYYNGVIFHRVIAGFMIQSGDPQGTGMGGESLWGGTFKTETDPNLKFDKPGILGMARTQTPDTNGSQWFITVAPQPSLDGHYTVFGEVVKGMDVVNAISKVPTDPNDRPRTPIRIESITIEKE